VPAEVVLRVLGCHPVEAANPLREMAVVGVDILTVKAPIVDSNCLLSDNGSLDKASGVGVHSGDASAIRSIGGVLVHQAV
jgi:hypothetical protein